MPFYCAFETTEGPCCTSCIKQDLSCPAELTYSAFIIVNSNTTFQLIKSKVFEFYEFSSFIEILGGEVTITDSSFHSISSCGPLLKNVAHHDLL